jgi:hypothetical protein
LKTGFAADESECFCLPIALVAFSSAYDVFWLSTIGY